MATFLKKQTDKEKPIDYSKGGNVIIDGEFICNLDELKQLKRKMQFYRIAFYVVAIATILISIFK